ncbi:hypothetical protein OHB24_36500 [Kribbella sp. NBC_00482]|uniref:hypothetical protein n=1 Tax=Kribbella sp. NBC_00482 TaxID=2975968 RepID=UPI002E1818F7
MAVEPIPPIGQSPGTAADGACRSASARLATRRLRAVRPGCAPIPSYAGHETWLAHLLVVQRRAPQA